MRIISSKYIPAIRTILFVLLCLWVSSCVGIEDNGVLQKQRNSPSVPISVAINLSDISWENGDRVDERDTDLTKSQVILRDNSKDPLIIDNQPKVLAIGENNSVIAYVYLKYDSNTGKVKELRNGDKFRVIVYKKSDGSYFSHKDYVVKKPYGQYEHIKLNNGVEYIVISYTFGSELPDILDSEKENINKANVHFDKENSSLLAYRKQYFIPSNDDPSKNSINVDLIGKSSLVSVVFRSLGSNIPIEKANLEIRSNTHFDTAKMDLNTGKLSCVSGCSNESKFTTNIDGGINISYERQFFVLNNKKSISLDAKIKMFGLDEYLKDIYFYMYQGKKATVYIDLRVCGAYTGAGKTSFKRFMCNDLGGDVINPNQNEVRDEQHGNFHIWGIIDPVVTRQFFQEQPQNKPKWRFDWSGAAKRRIRIVSNFTEVCPKGWHVPNQKEWENVVDNNLVENVFNGSTIFSLGTRVGENMILPLSGFIDGDGVTYLPKTDSFAYRWAEDRIKNVGGEGRGIVVRFNGSVCSDVYSPVSLFQGHPLRCMKD